MNTSKSYDEWLEDFGERRADDAAIQSLLERTRTIGDVELRSAIKEIQMWRWPAPLLLERLAPGGSPIDESDHFLKLARFLVRGEGASGAS